MAKEHQKSKHLDKMVVFVFFGAMLISIGSMAFKYITLVPCGEVTFSLVAPEYRVGELIVFDDNTEGAESWLWEFGDDSEVETRKNVMHTYSEQGTYKVRLLVNNSCEQIETVTILPKKIIKDPSKYPVFTVPKMIRVGQKLRVEDETENASTWEWRFGENASVDATSRIAEYIYEEPGLKTVRLVVNGNVNYVGTAQIEVLPAANSKQGVSFIKDKPKQYESSIKDKPEIVEQGESFIKKAPEEKKAEVPYISNDAFGDKLEQIANEQIQPQSFKDYFCGDLDKKIVVNGKSTTFLEFCANIKGKKRLKVTGVNIIRAVENSNCITNVVVEHKKLGWF